MKPTGHETVSFLFIVTSGHQRCRVTYSLACRVCATRGGVCRWQVGDTGQPSASQQGLVGVNTMRRQAAQHTTRETTGQGKGP